MAGTVNKDAITREINGSIDGIMKAIELLPFWEDLQTGFNVNVSSPIGYLLQVSKCLGIMNEIKNFLGDFLSFMLPGIELGVKGVLLSNLTSALSCTTSPIIPDNLRQSYYRETFKVKSNVANNDGNYIWDKMKNIKDAEFIFSQKKEYGEGLIININAIDYDGMLNISPFPQPKKKNTFDNSTLYFGVNSGNTSPYQLARASDFNAFLWFVKNKGIFRKPILINSYTDLGELETDGDNKGSSIFNYCHFTKNIDSKYTGLTNGTLFAYSGNPTTMSVVSDVVVDDRTNAVTSFKLYPICNYDDNTNRLFYNSNKPGIMWFANEPGVLRNLLTTETNLATNINHGYDKGLFNLYSDINGENFVLRILPKPFTHYPIRTKEIKEPITRVKKIVFNAQGKSPGKGNLIGNKRYRFSVNPKILGDGSVSRSVDSSGICTYDLLKHGDSGIISDIKLIYDTNNGTYKLEKKGTHEEPTEQEAAEILYETYGATTIYEFNYDYIMGMKLLNGKVIMTRIMNMLMGLNVNLNLSKEQIQAQKIITEVVKKVIESEEEYNDCFFNFSNDELNRLMEESDLKRKNNVDFNDGLVIPKNSAQEIMDKLASLNSAVSKVEEKNTFIDTIEIVTDAYSTGKDAEDKYGIGVNLIEQICMQLVFEIVMGALLTPKISMLLQVNNFLLGKNDKSIHTIINLEDLIKSLLNIIIPIVKEIVKMFIEELFRFVMDKMKVVLALFGTALLKEYADLYINLLTTIIRECGFKVGKNTNLVGIDNVLYADIDEFPLQEPNNNDC